MPRFFFHMHFGAPLLDLDGVELPDVIAARQEALRYAVALVANEAVDVCVHGGGKAGHWSVGDVLMRAGGISGH